LQAGIWYPSNVQLQPAPHPLGPFSQDVALNTPIAGQGLPLILISHGTGGSLASHLDTPDSHVVPGADHFAFLPPCSESLAAAAPQICADAAGFARAAFHRA
jgi:predicted dienelactone hydrolase